MRNVLSAFFAVLILLVSGLPAYAQMPALAQAATAPATDEKKSESDKPTDEQIKSFIKTMEDPKSRDAFLSNLKAMQATTENKPASEAPSVAALDAVSKAVDNAGKNFSNLVSSLADVKETGSWAQRQWQNDTLRTIWLQIVISILSALAVGAAVYYGLKYLLKGFRAAFSIFEGKPLLVRVLAFVGYHFLTLVPVIGFAASSMFTLNAFDVLLKAEATARTIIYGFICFQIAVWVVRILFARHVPQLRLIPISNESAAYLFVWSQRLAGVIIFSYFLTRAGMIMEMPEGTLSSFTTLMGLMVTLMMVIIVLQNRESVSGWLRGPVVSEEKTHSPDNKDYNGIWTRTRARLADTWHVLAIIYLCVGYVVATLDQRSGFGTLLRATLITLIIVVSFRFILSGIDRLMAHGFALPKELKSQFPLLEERTNSYLPILQRVVKALAWVAAILILLSAWGVDIAAWFATPFGQKIILSGSSIAIALLLAVVFWEIINAFVDGYLRGTDSAGNPVYRSARMLTLMPLLRHTLQILLVVVMIFFILSEVGVDITPLLAGAGIIGLAIGFGAQTLVKDFITGLFILLEDTIAIGDVVTVGDHSGQVEGMTIRTLKLRDQSGQVHSIPFSEVTSVINQTKYFSYAVIEIGVSYDADLRHVMEVMKSVADVMMQDPAMRPLIYEKMEMLGVERFDASSIAIKARIKTQPLKQWPVKREYQLRLKEAFDKEGIDIPYPITTTIHAPDKVEANKEIVKEMGPPVAAPPNS